MLSTAAPRTLATAVAGKHVSDKCAIWINDRASIITIWGCFTSISHKHSEGSGGVEGKKRNKMERMQEARQILIVCVGVLYKSNLQNCAVLLCSIVVLGAKVLANCLNMGVLCHFLPLKSHFWLSLEEFLYNLMPSADSSLFAAWSALCNTTNVFNQFFSFSTLLFNKSVCPSLLSVLLLVLFFCIFSLFLTSSGKYIRTVQQWHKDRLLMADHACVFSIKLGSCTPFIWETIILMA